MSEMPDVLCWTRPIRHGEGVHGIAVWPHGHARIRLEANGSGLVALFADTSSILIPDDGMTLLISDHFVRNGAILAWSRRRGIDVGLVVDGPGRTVLKIRPSGPPLRAHGCEELDSGPIHHHQRIACGIYRGNRHQTCGVCPTRRAFIMHALR